MKLSSNLIKQKSEEYESQISKLKSEKKQLKTYALQLKSESENWAQEKKTLVVKIKDMEKSIENLKLNNFHNTEPPSEILNNHEIIQPEVNLTSAGFSYSNSNSNSYSNSISNSNSISTPKHKSFGSFHENYALDEFNLTAAAPATPSWKALFDSIQLTNTDNLNPRQSELSLLLRDSSIDTEGLTNKKIERNSVNLSSAQKLLLCHSPLGF